MVKTTVSENRNAITKEGTRTEKIASKLTDHLSLLRNKIKKKVQDVVMETEAEIVVAKAKTTKARKVLTLLKEKVVIIKGETKTEDPDLLLLTKLVTLLMVLIAESKKIKNSPAEKVNEDQGLKVKTKEADSDQTDHPESTKKAKKVRLKVVNKDNDLTEHQENSKKVKKVRVKVVNKDSDPTDHPGNTKKVKKVKSKDQDPHVNQENLKMSKTPTQDQAILTEATTRTEVPDAQEVNIVAEEVVSKATKLLEVNPVEEVIEADIVETTKADIVAKTKAGIAATTKADIVAKTQTAAQTSPEMVTIDIQLFNDKLTTI